MITKYGPNELKSTHRRHISQLLKKRRHNADPSLTHHRPITDTSSIFINTSQRIFEFLKKCWRIAGPSSTYRRPIINSSPTYHRHLIANASLNFLINVGALPTHHQLINSSPTHHWFSSTHRGWIPEFLKNIDALLTHQLIDFHWRFANVSLNFWKKHRRIADPSSTHHWRIIDFHRCKIGLLAVSRPKICRNFKTKNTCLIQISALLDHFWPYLIVINF